jgi:hypothetical protein
VEGTPSVGPSHSSHVSHQVRGSLGALPQPSDSKRYPEPEDEYAIVLDRYNTILDELFAGTDVFVVTMGWSNTPTEPEGYPDATTDTASRRHPLVDRVGAGRPRPGVPHTHTRLYADRRRWNRGCLAELLRAVADETLVEGFVADTELWRIHHPYGGGADVILATPAERDHLRDQHQDWLFQPPSWPLRAGTAILSRPTLSDRSMLSDTPRAVSAADRRS